jgi:hypothetical protein
MAQRLTNSFVNTVRPGSYFDVKVKSTPVGVASSGNIVLIGEASGGAAAKGVDSANGDVLKDNFYTPDQLAQVEAKYISGPIVDAFRAISSPSSDANINGSANRIYIAKTNQASKAETTIATAYGTLSDKNWGIDGNKYSYQVSQSLAEVTPTITGSVIALYGAPLDGTEFKIRLNGGAEATVTLSGTPADHADLTTLLVELNALLPVGIDATAGTAANTVKLTIAADVAANSKGWGKSFELIDSTPGDLAALGLAAGLTTSAQEPEVQIDINRQDTNTNESFLAAAEVAMEIGYDGTTATLTITDTALTTTVTGGTGANLSLQLNQYNTISDLAAYINSQTGYTCSVAATSTQTAPAMLDNLAAQPICSTAASLKPGRVKRAAANMEKALSQSSVLDFDATATAGLPDVMATKVFLTGGAKGSTSAADVADAVTDLEGINANFVVPLFSRNASADIADGLTDSSSAYTIDAINALVKSHVLKMSTAKIKKHRSAFLSFWGSFSDAKDKAGSLAHYRVSLCMQKTSQSDSKGVIQNFMPWHTAAVAAGMQAAGFYKSITNKFANVISYEDPTGFDSGSPGDIEEAIEAGLLFLEKAVVGSKWVVDQTTYGIDTNFVYNSIQAVYGADLVSLDLAESFQTAFVGQSLADVDAATAIAFLASKMDQYKKQKLIAASDDAPLGFKNAKVKIEGPIMSVSVEIKLATAILFIPINIEVSQVQSVA